MNPTGAESDIKDILPPDPLSNFWSLLMWGVIGVLIVGAIVWLLAFYVLKDRRRPSRGPSPQQIALGKLQELAARSGELTPNEFSLQVSETLKDYLSQRFGDPLRYETSEEFIARLSSESGGRLPNSKRELVAGFVQISDEIKFGRPPDAESKKPSLLEQARAVIESNVEQ